MCVFAKTIYNTKCDATRKVRRASASFQRSACTTDSAVTPAVAVEATATAAEAVAVAVKVAYGGRLLRFSFGQRKYKEIWKIRCEISYVCIVRFYEHTGFFSFLVFFSLFFVIFLLLKCVFCIQY